MTTAAAARFAQAFHRDRNDAAPRPMGAEFEFCLCDLASDTLRPPGLAAVRRLLSSLRCDYEARVDSFSSETIALIGADGGVIAPDYSCGTLELSTPPGNSLSHLEEAYRLHVERLLTACEENGLTMLGVGLHPFVVPAGELIFTSNSRYRTDGLNHLQTTSQAIHVTLGVSASEAIEQYRMFTMICPVMLAMFANSSYAEGRATGIATLRELMWTTAILDEKRIGIGPDVNTLSDYFDALSRRPFSRLVRQGQTYHIPDRVSFRDFLDRKYVATRNRAGESFPIALDDDHISADITAHESTTWFNVRLRHGISALEIRAADMLAPHQVLRPAAFCRGLSAVASSVQGLLDNVRWADLPRVRVDAIFRGLEGDYFGMRMRDAAVALCDCARIGLAKLGETPYLGHIDDLRNDLAEQVDAPGQLLTRKAALDAYRFSPRRAHVVAPLV